MTKKAKLTKFALIGILLLTGVLILASCAPAAAPPAPAPPKPERMPPSVSVIPNVAGPAAKITYAGANFEPGEKVKVAILVWPGSEYLPSNKGELVEINELGSFMIESKLPSAPGVYPVRVYDEKGKMIASAAVLVEE